jgi:uncharacterized protein YneF (UPF0154 family)
MVLFLEISFASIAIILSMVSLRTLRAIKYLSVGKSFWLPVLFSGILFLVGSVIAVLTELGFSFTSYTVEIISSCQLSALCFLAGGVYSYSRKITKNLVEKFPLPERTLKSEVEANEEPKPSEPIVEQLHEKTVGNEAGEAGCKHHLGYLQTLQKNAHIPEECLGCHQIIECKYSLVKKAESASKSSAISKTIHHKTFSDAILHKENPSSS